MRTKLSNEEYVDQAGGVCPFCESEHINADHIQADGNYAWGEVNCETCGETWDDVYILKGYDLERRNGHGDLASDARV